MHDVEYLAVAFNGSPPQVQCGESIWILQMPDGYRLAPWSTKLPRPPLDSSSLDAAVRAHQITQLASPLPVKSEDIALYLGRPLAKNLALAELPLARLENGSGIVVSVSPNKAQSLRERLGDLLMRNCEMELRKLLGSPDPSDEIIKALENTAELGLEAVGRQQNRLYYKFSKFLGAALVLGSQDGDTLQRVWKYAAQRAMPSVEFGEFRQAVNRLIESSRPLSSSPNIEPILSPDKIVQSYGPIGQLNAV